MTLQDTLSFQGVTLGRASIEPTADSEPKTFLPLLAPFNPSVAKTLGIHDIIYSENDTPREGFEKVPLEIGIDQCKAKIVGSDESGIRIEFLTEGIDKLTVVRRNGALLGLAMRVKLKGYAPTIAELITHVGTGEVFLMLTPTQMALFEAEKQVTAEEAASDADFMKELGIDEADD